MRHRQEVKTVGKREPRRGLWYLHYVLDEWVAQQWRPRKVPGDMIIVRYADDYVVGFESGGDARWFVKELAERFAQYGLDLHLDKTRLLEFGKNAIRDWRARREGRRSRVGAARFLLFFYSSRV